MRDIDQSRRAHLGAGGHTARAPLGRHARAAALLLSATLAGCGDLDGLAGPPSAPPGVSSPSADRAALNASDGAIPGQYIVVFRDSVGDAPGLARRLVGEHGGELRFSYTSTIKGFAARLPERAVEALERNPQVAYVEADRLARATDVQTPAPWNLDRIDQRTLPIDSRYSYASAGAGVSAYIIDTGIRTTHVEFGERAFGVFTAINDGKGTNDCGSHGTHVAGTVGGARYGVAKGVKLYAVRVLACDGTGPTSGVIAGVDWVTRNRVLPAVATMSMTGASSPSLNLAIQNSIKSGVVYAVAAGNSAADACNYSPANTPEALTVGASSNSDGVSGYSNFGPCVDLFAPGEAIRSAYSVDDTSSVYKGGTSMATPHVAGVAALYLSTNATATPAQVAAVIVGGATANALKNATSGSPNLILYSGVTTGATPPADTSGGPLPAPSDPVTPPAPPPVSDQPPTATFTARCARGKCTFDASGSADDHGVASYQWDFGDGSAAGAGGALASVQHTYSAPGKFTVALTVTDTAGQRRTTSTVVNIRKA